MCGIAGIHLKDGGHPAEFSLEQFVDALLLGIEHRGTDATGFVACDKEGRSITLDKKPRKASDFIMDRTPLPDNARTVLLHTRLGTQGSEHDPANNHPVISKTAFVTHNGMIWNDDSLFREYRLPRHGKVDTEIISALIAEFGLEETKAVCKELRGSYAFAAINPVYYKDRLVLVRGNNSPLVILDHPKMLVWASELKAIEDAWGLVIGTPPAFNKFRHLSEGTILHVNGNTIEHDTFEPERLHSYTYGWPGCELWEGEEWEELDEGETAPVPALPTGGAWREGSDGIWRRERADGQTEIFYWNTKERFAANGHYGVDKDLTNSGMCWICRNRVAVATLVDGAGDTEWTIPVCIPCFRGDTDDSRGFNTERGEQSQKCSDCNSTATSLEMNQGWQKGTNGRRLCVRCKNDETPISPGQGGSKDISNCVVCDTPRAMYETQDGHPLCSRCHLGDKEMIECEGCKVYHDSGKITSTWAGKLCEDCCFKADNGAYCAECREWFSARNLEEYQGVLYCKPCAGADRFKTEDRHPDKLAKYEEMATKSKAVYDRLCTRVAWDMNSTTEFVDWILVLCPKTQFTHDKQLERLWKLAKASYDRHLEEWKKEKKEQNAA